MERFIANAPESVDADARFMQEALHLAASVPVRPWPNPPVGAVVVKHGRIIGRGAHQGPGTSHAEVMALAEAGAEASGATLYVTLEPCNHTGRTPPCAPAVAEAGITRVVAAMRDPNPLVKGGGCRHLRECGLQVNLGTGAAAALELVWPFAATNGFQRPYVELKTATSMDARFAPPDALRRATEPVYLTAIGARKLVHRRRRWCDAVLVGEGTARADRPRLDGRLVDGEPGIPGVDPVAGYLDTELSWTGGLNRGQFLVFAGESALRSPNAATLKSAGAEIITCREIEGRLDLRHVLEVAFERGLRTILFEGGPGLATALLEAGLVDRWLQFVAPAVLGSGITWPAHATGAEVRETHPFTLTRCENVGGDALLVHDRLPFAAKLDEVSR